MISISVVIPAYNEEHRLPETLKVLKQFVSLKQSAWSVQEIIVVNDGSTDKTASLVEEVQKEWPLLQLVSFPLNKGKGAAVHAGMQKSSSAWILIADADMATPWDELNKFATLSNEAELIMGSRALPQSDIVIRQHWIRQSMGKTFNKILKFIVGLPFHDTQCGFKLLKNDSFFRLKVLPLLQVERFSWDVELILFLMKFNKKILEVPIRWEHKEESHVHIVRDSLEMLFTVLKLKKRVRSE
ncbi:dolichyl-phosphate beta-glucosyltransferase [Bdellovibrio bacteriovorus]|uniref:dolichyl-phosphate beta-glucosyltransferase n=1 Tax=Bdellovibrio bacteriovorus TaxID=959 RepID=UPI0035A82D04